MTDDERRWAITYLRELAHRGGQLRSADADFDQRVGVVIRNLVQIPWATRRQIVAIANCPGYSASVDQAMRLTPDGWAMSLCDRPWLGSLGGDRPVSITMWRQGEIEASVCGQAWTRPLAICVGNLLAIAADLASKRHPTLASP